MSKSRKASIISLNVMVIGATGTGKTCFVRTINERVKRHCVKGSFRESSRCVSKGPIQPTQELYTVSMHLKQLMNHHTTDFTIIDTQGLVKGFALDHQLVFLTKYIEHQMKRSLVEEFKVKRDPKAHDSRIHACLYFIDTQTCGGLSDLDRYAIKVLSSRVNVIPIISKADTLSTRQLTQLKTDFRKSVFDVYSIPLYGLVNFEDDDKDGYNPFTPINTVSYNEDDSITLGIQIGMLKEVKKTDAYHNVQPMIDYLEKLPLSLINYEEDAITGRPLATDKTGESILGRIYPWTIVNCCDPTHCDLERLVDILFSSHGDMLRLNTAEWFYEQYRIDQLLSQRVDEMIDIKSTSNGEHSSL